MQFCETLPACMPPVMHPVWFRIWVACMQPWASLDHCLVFHGGVPKRRGQRSQKPSSSPSETTSIFDIDRLVNIRPPSHGSSSIVSDTPHRAETASLAASSGYIRTTLESCNQRAAGILRRLGTFGTLERSTGLVRQLVSFQPFCAGGLCRVV